jgi:hypothetical protein
MRTAIQEPITVAKIQPEECLFCRLEMPLPE